VEEIDGYKQPESKYFLYPRLFVLRPDGTGTEYLTHEQLEYYFRVQKSRDATLKQRKHVIIGSTAAKSHVFLTKPVNLEDKAVELNRLRQLDFPQNARYS